MNLRFFIDRPVFSGVISVVIVLMGFIALSNLPVEQYPDIAPPTIQVFANYPGANAEVIMNQITEIGCSSSGGVHQRGGRYDLYHLHGL